MNTSKETCCRNSSRFSVDVNGLPGRFLVADLATICDGLEPKLRAAKTAQNLKLHRQTVKMGFYAQHPLSTTGS